MFNRINNISSPIVFLHDRLLFRFMIDIEINIDNHIDDTVHYFPLNDNNNIFVISVNNNNNKL